MTSAAGGIYASHPRPRIVLSSVTDCKQAFTLNNRNVVKKIISISESNNHPAL